MEIGLAIFGAAMVPLFCTEYMANKCFLELNSNILLIYHLAEFLYIPNLWCLVFNLIYAVTSFLHRKM